MYGKMLTLQLSYNFLSKIEIAPKFFCFFFNLKSKFVPKQTFSKKKICMQT